MAQQVIGTGGSCEGARQVVASSWAVGSAGRWVWVLRWRAVPSQVDLPLGGLAGWSGSWVVLHRLAQRDLLHATVFTGWISATGVGTAVGCHETHVGHFGAAATAATTWSTLLHRQGLGAAVGHQLLLPVHLLVRHEGGELGGILGYLAVGRRLAGHPAGVRVAKLGALPGAFTGHCHVGKRPEICRETQQNREEKAWVPWKQQREERWEMKMTLRCRGFT